MFGQSQGTSLFGGTSAFSKPTGFGTSTATSSAPLFGGQTNFFGGASTSSGTGLFSAVTTTGTSLFSSTTNTGTGLFAKPPPSFSSALGQAPAQLPQNDANLALLFSLTNPQIYGDERDEIIASLNQVLAFASVGKGYYTSGNNPPVDYTSSSNPAARFRTVGYSKFLGYRDEDGCVGLTINRNIDEVKNNMQNLKDGFFKIFGAKPTIAVHVEGSKPLPDNKSEVIIYVTEVQPGGAKRRVKATDLAKFLQSIKPQLQSNFLVEEMVLKMDMDPAALKQYLENAPIGIDPLLWSQAVKENPDPKQFIPVQMIGFSQLKSRKDLQVEQLNWQESTLQKLSEELKRRNSQLAIEQNRAKEYATRQKQLAHRLLKVTAMQHMLSRQGHSLDALEENLHGRLENLSAQLSNPLSCKGRLLELSSLLRSHPDALIGSQQQRKQHNLDATTAEEVESFLTKFQSNLEELHEIAKQDRADLELISQQLKLNTSRR